MEEGEGRAENALAEQDPNTSIYTWSSDLGIVNRISSVVRC